MPVLWKSLIVSYASVKNNTTVSGVTFKNLEPVGSKVGLLKRRTPPGSTCMLQPLRDCIGGDSFQGLRLPFD